MRLEIKDFCLSYHNKEIIKHASLSVDSSEVGVLIGPSGSGKSLLGLGICGYVPDNLTKTRGEVLLNGKVLENTESARLNFAQKSLSIIMQNPRTCFNPLFSIKSHYVETLQALGMRADLAFMESSLQEVGLEREVLGLYPFELSGGMLQRVMIVLALAANPLFLIADEITTDLDLLTQYKILEILKKVRKKRNLGILFITHDLEVAAHLADKIYILKNGEITQCLDFPFSISRLASIFKQGA
ncbi:ATP-binding cassette domain-containing protein [Helicobacter himalayensis]|uniref:ATP-binding cassette domain-containing protein n=1 Tax=Helicobacter himalayensis TaxID=1591088 RepID=UPI003D6F1746